LEIQCRTGALKHAHARMDMMSQPESRFLLLCCHRTECISTAHCPEQQHPSYPWIASNKMDQCIVIILQ